MIVAKIPTNTFEAQRQKSDKDLSTPNFTY